ncbi:MAG: DNA gyrase subunit A [Nitrospinales bacterium]
MPDTVEQINIEDEMKNSYLDYAMSVIVGRALPDARDGLKPVHRRVLFAMSEQGNTFDKPYKKSARIVGDVIGKYHPHGDQAAYDTIVRMAQDFSLRYPLVDGQGNFGSIDGDSAAAMRYTEIRMAEIAVELLRDLEKETVEFKPNYDESLEEPSLLPAGIPNLLVNGASGIAVGMATNIPPHNLKEVITAIIHMIKNPDCSVEDLIRIIPGPDFPTRGLIMGAGGIHSAYRTGRGIIKVRARVEIETREKDDRSTIIVKEMPYQVNKARVVEKIAALVREKRIDGISDLRDESDREGIRIVIELKRGVIPEVVLNNLYKHTQLQETFGIIMLALVNNQPRVLNLKDVLHHFILFRKEVVTRRTEFDLRKAREREHVYEGLKIAVDNLDEIVALIRAAADPAAAREDLMARFALSEIQARAILDMRLQRLTGLERRKIVQELESIRQLIGELLNILAHDKVKLEIIVDELTAIKEKYGDERRTEIVGNSEADIHMEDMIADDEMVVTYSRGGYIKRDSLENYRAQRRGGKGVKGMNVKEEDVVQELLIASNLSDLLIFTNVGKVHWLKVYRIPEASRTAKGRPIVNFINFREGEKIAGILLVKKFEDDKFIIAITQNGIVKKTSLAAYSRPRQGGIIGLTIDDDDRLIGVKLSDGNKDIFLVTRNGMSIRFQEKEIRAIGRTGRGVIGIRLREGDQVVGGEVVEPGVTVLTVTEKGYGKRTDIKEYPIQGRGGCGVFTIRCNEKIGRVVGIRPVTSNDEILIVSSDGKIIRMNTNEISVIGRNTQGVRLVRLNEDDRVVSFERLVE